MASRWLLITLTLVIGAIALTAGRATATHPFYDALIRYDVDVADNRPAVPSDLRLNLRFSALSSLPDPFGGITHQTPGPWKIAADEQIPNGDGVGRLAIVLGNALTPSVMPCPLAPAVRFEVPLADASSDSSAADYPPYLPQGEHKARWTGRFEYGEAIIPVNVLVDPTPSLEFGDRLQLFAGTGPGTLGVPELDQLTLDHCFSLLVSLGVAGASSSGAPVAVNPPKQGVYTFAAELASKADPTATHDHTIRLTAEVLIGKGPAEYAVHVRDRNPGVASDLHMGLHFRPKRPLPQPFGGVTHRAPAQWKIAPDESVPDGDGVGRLYLRLNVLPSLSNVCPVLLPNEPSLALAIPLRDASSDSTAADYPPFLPEGNHQSRWAGAIGHPSYRIPVNVLVDEASTGATAMRIFIGRGPHHIDLRPLLKCLSLDVGLQVAGHSQSGVPIAVNPAEEGTYSFVAHVVTLPKPKGETKEFDLKAEVVIEESAPPAPCLDCEPGDEDFDTVADGADLCRQDPEDLDSHDVSDGCPDSGDTDGDELVDLLEWLLLADPASPDSDGDGCTDGSEFAGDETLGGMRDPTNEWDFFDTPPADATVSVGDILSVVGHFGATAGPPASPDYSTSYDRSTVGPNLWNLGPPDGAISVGDILAVVGQFGHSCA